MTERIAQAARDAALGGATLLQLMKEADLGVAAEDSALAPLTPDQADFRARVGTQVDAIKGRGNEVDLDAFAD